MSRTIALGAAAVICAAIFQTPTHAAAKPHKASALTIVKICPITKEKVVGNGAGSEVVGHYKVYFCCGDCQPAFDKLSSAQKLAKVTAVASTKSE